jgi:hypothetical protein
MLLLNRLLAAALCAVSIPVSVPAFAVDPVSAVGAASTGKQPIAMVSTAAAQSNAPITTRRFGFPEIDKHQVFRLHPIDGTQSIYFGRRADEAVTRAVLKVNYRYSPLLTPVQSHIKVLFNNDVVGIVPITRDNIGKQATAEVEIDPRLIGTNNKLSLEFIGHYTNECEGPTHSGMWVELLPGTEVQLSTQRIALQNDLAMLPQPFFDPQDYSRLNLPFVFAGKPSYDTLRSAGIASSWFGKLASWRRARFPVYLDRLPKGHAVVLASNSERPSFLAGSAPFTGPGLTVMTNPADGYSKLLLITGRDEADLKTATNALVLGNGALSGTHIDITKVREEAPRKAYDAPNWVRLDRPMKFGELVESPQQLQVFGHVPGIIHINLRIPPDLFTWHSRGVPVNLKFRYTPPVRSGDSRLAMSVNGERVDMVNLRSSGQGGDATHVTLPLLDSGLLGEGNELLIPAFKLGERNQIDYAFFFSYLTTGPCRDMQIENVQAMIDPNSSIDFSSYPHYVEMPHLGYFATAGFPFTKYADLAQTTVVMPQTPSAEDIEVMLTLLGRMGESTGYPATRVTVAGPSDQAAQRDKDLLVIGVAPNQSLLDQWSDKLPAIIAGPHRMIRKVPGELNKVYGWLGFNTDPAPDKKVQNHLRGNGPLAAILGLESPVSKKRSVVAITAYQDQDLHIALDELENDAIVQRMHGSVALMYGGTVENFFAGKNYKLGSLPFWTRIWFPLSGHPILLAIMGVAAVLVFAFALWRTLRSIAQRRLQ